MPDDLESKADSLEEETTPETPVIYEAVRRLGEQELARHESIFKTLKFSDHAPITVDYEFDL